MQLSKTLLAVCLLCRLLTGAVVYSASEDSPRDISERISVKSTASRFLKSVFREKEVNLDPRTWVVGDKDKAPKTWTINSMPQCLLARQWMEGDGRVVALHHEATPYLKPNRVTAKVIITSNSGDKGGLFSLSIKNEVYNGNKQLKLVAMAVIHPGFKGTELRKPCVGV